MKIYNICKISYFKYQPYIRDTASYHKKTLSSLPTDTDEEKGFKQRSKKDSEGMKERIVGWTELCVLTGWRNDAFQPFPWRQQYSIINSMYADDKMTVHKLNDLRHVSFGSVRKNHNSPLNKTMQTKNKRLNFGLVCVLQSHRFWNRLLSQHVHTSHGQQFCMHTILTFVTGFPIRFIVRMPREIP